MELKHLIAFVKELGIGIPDAFPQLCQSGETNVNRNAAQGDL
jgi:hypothetical protein